LLKRLQLLLDIPVLDGKERLNLGKYFQIRKANLTKGFKMPPPKHGAIHLRIGT